VVEDQGSTLLSCLSLEDDDRKKGEVVAEGVRAEVAKVGWAGLKRREGKVAASGRKEEGPGGGNEGFSL
jgi:hypothetical protein